MKAGWNVNTPSYDSAVKTNWDGVDKSEFEDEDEWRSVHLLQKNGAVALPVAHRKDGELKLVLEALKSAYELAETVKGVSDDTVVRVREEIESIRADEFPDSDSFVEGDE